MTRPVRRCLLLATAVALALWAGAAHAQRPGPVLVVGDSLEADMGRQLERELAPADVRVDARPGRPSAEGLRVLRDLIRPSHRIVVFDLGTNDDPSRPSRLRATLGAVRRAAGGRCLVVATLVRPPLDGVSADGMNDVVKEFASSNPDVRLADWRATARRSPDLLSRDRVHATRAGYVARARLVAQAVSSCSEDGSEPQPGAPEIAQENPLSQLVELLPLDLPLGLLRGTADLVEGAARQAEGAVVPIAPDAVLGRERDPLGKRAP